MPSLIKKKTNTAAEQEESFLPASRRIAALADSKKAKDIKAYDVRGLTLIADAFVMCTATSEPQMKAVLNAVHDGMKKETGLHPLQVEGSYHNDWMVMDYGDIIVHIFRPQAREYYDLDGLWADSKEIELDLESIPAE